jgi:hypothetical protein
MRGSSQPRNAMSSQRNWTVWPVSPLSADFCPFLALSQRGYLEHPIAVRRSCAAPTWEVLMGRQRISAHPYLPNNARATRARISAEIGAASRGFVLMGIPSDPRARRLLELPDLPVAEMEPARQEGR